jgi:DNA-binding LacI/PurR family transcriptional regulator
MVLAIEERAYEMGYEIILAHSLNLPEREETVIRRLLSRRVDGILIAPVYRLAPKAMVYDELVQRAIPAVILGYVAPFCSGFVCIETEDRLASTSITQHLLQLGHQRIAFFGGPVAAPWAQARFEGYRRALREAGIEVHDALIFSAGSSVEEGEKAALQFLNESPLATAIQSVNDQVAAGAANILIGQGIRIPQDLSITGFGNVLAGHSCRVPLTTIGQPKYRLGIEAMEMMRKLLLGQRVESRHLSEELIIRESTAPPPIG